MSERDERIREEAERLWRELFNEPPAIRSEGALMLNVIVGLLPVAPYRSAPYQFGDEAIYPAAHDACRDRHPRPSETDQQVDRGA